MLKSKRVLISEGIEVTPINYSPVHIIATCVHASCLAWCQYVCNSWRSYDRSCEGVKNYLDPPPSKIPNFKLVHADFKYWNVTENKTYWLSWK